MHLTLHTSSFRDFPVIRVIKCFRNVLNIGNYSSLLLSRDH